MGIDQQQVKTAELEYFHILLIELGIYFDHSRVCGKANHLRELQSSVTYTHKPHLYKKCTNYLIRCVEIQDSWKIKITRLLYIFVHTYTISFLGRPLRFQLCTVVLINIQTFSKVINGYVILLKLTWVFKFIVGKSYIISKYNVGYNNWCLLPLLHCTHSSHLHSA